MPRTASQRGFALITVVGGLAVLSLVILAFTYIIRLRVQSVANLSAAIRAEALADAGTYLAIDRLLRASIDNPLHQANLRPDDQALECTSPDLGTIRVQITDEAGKLDLNTTHDELLFKLVRSFTDLPSEGAWRVVDAIVDFRDEDDLRRARGAEAPDYIAAGLPTLPKNAPFESIGELEQVAGINSRIVAVLRPHLTVFSHLSGIDLSVASQSLQTALATQGISPSGPEYLLTTSDRKRFSLLAEGRTIDHATFVRRAVIELYPAPDTPFAIRDWGQSEKKLGSMAAERSSQLVSTTDCRSY